MGLDVVNGQQRFSPGEAIGLGGGGADQEAADEAGAVGDGDAIELGGGVVDVRKVESFLDDGGERFKVGPGGDFRDHAAEFGVEVDLRGDDVRADLAAIFHNGGGGFIAGGFDAEDGAQTKLKT